MRVDHSTPVVVLSRGMCHTSTCIARSLGTLGVPVYSVEAALGSPASFSRYCKGQFIWNEKVPAAERVQRLLQIGERIGQKSILIATTDVAEVLVADNADALERWFIFPRLNPDLVHTLCSKKEMYHLATRLGIATPRAAFPASRRDILDFLETAVFPVVLKGIDGHKLAARSGDTMFIVRSAPELLKIYDSAEDPDDPNLMLQEYIPGEDETVCGLEGYFDESSECLFSATARKLRQWPAYRGVTSFGVCSRMEEIETITRRFMKKIGYRGILDIGYRYDVRDGLYKVLDVNPRIGCTFRLFVGENGMDVARALYLDLTGQPVEADKVREGRKWLAEDLDLVASPRYLLDRKITPMEWLRSFGGLQESAYFSLKDPLPFVALCLGRGWQLIREVCTKVSGHVRTALTGRERIAFR